MAIIQRFSVLLIGVVLALTLSACTSKTVLFSGIGQEEANEIYSTLVKAGVPTEKSADKQGHIITVPQALASDALKILEARGLPHDKRTTLGDVFKKEGMISSPLEERARYLHALSQELEKTLLNMDGVLSARVHIVLPERTAPGEPLAPSSAAVFVKYENGTAFPAYVGKVRELVFKSIPGITGDPHTSVTVAAVPSDARADTGVTLIWYGPLAMHPDDKVYFLSLIYLTATLWALSLMLVWLQGKKEEDWPEFLRRIKQRFLPS